MKLKNNYMAINLEKVLIKQNRKIVTPAELLLIREFETHAEHVNNDALSRIGINQTIKEGEGIKKTIDNKKKGTLKFQQERVFHISQIKAICEKYYLRFLPVKYYKGTIDKDLPTKIVNFEAAYGVRCTEANTKICAPIESFRLQEAPKDPLLFYLINDEYFYLVHKWGNDLSVTRRAYGLLSNGWFCWAMGIIVFLSIGGALLFSLLNKTALIAACGFWSILFSVWIKEGMTLSILPGNDWDSEFRGDGNYV